MQTLAIDVDGTLIDHEDNVRLDVVNLLKYFHELGWTTIVWSGGGQDYAEMWVHRLGIEPLVDRIEAKPIGEGKTEIVDIAVDDFDVKFGKVNICVGSGGVEY